MRTDYLVKGCGASAMAFVDVMLHETEATFTIVDKHAAPGGHWNDAYPFVRLHQPAAYYGVPSRELGSGRKETTGLNRGLFELAPGIQVANYYHQVMREYFLPTGRVSYYPMCELIESEDGARSEIVSLLSGDRREVEIGQKLVDATLLSGCIPLTHRRNFDVAIGVLCVPPNELPRVAPNHSRFTVLGAGKTAIDSILWLLTNGAKPDSITWVLPRDPWLINQANWQPGEEFFERGIGTLASQLEDCARATSIRDLFERMEASKVWLRLDRAVWPTMMHCARISEMELDQLRLVRNMIRGQRVRRIEPSGIVLSAGDVPMEDGALYIDCTASALRGVIKNRRPVFSQKRVSLQMVRQNQATFSAALIGHVEAMISDEAEKEKLTQVVPVADTAEEWAAMMAVSLSNQIAWGKHKAMVDWIATCRLDLFSRRVRQIPPNDYSKRSILMRIRSSALPAMENLYRLSQAGTMN